MNSIVLFFFLVLLIFSLDKPIDLFILHKDLLTFGIIDLGANETDSL